MTIVQVSCASGWKYKDLSVLEDILSDVLQELARADAKHPPMAEPVEGLYTLRCEVMELAREIHRANKNPVDTRRESIQVAAMALKFLRDCCPQTVKED